MITLDCINRLIGFQPIGFQGFSLGVSIMSFERGQCYVIAYRKGGVGKSPFRSVLVCSVRGNAVYAIPLDKLVRHNAEKKIAEILEIPFFGKRPEPQTFLLDRVKYGRQIVDYKKYMEKRIADFVKTALDEMKTAK